MKKISIIIALCSLAFWTQAQNQKVQFNGAARGNIENNWLPNSDTTNIDQEITGNTLVDLRMDIRPSNNIRIKTDFRFSNPMGGFWGQGAAIELRHISLKGVANNSIKYRFGDIDLKMTPYTLYNYNGELSNNEAEIFKDSREICEEENFNYGNSWHQQGADIAFKLGFDKLIESADVSGFVVRNRSVEGNVFPDRLQAGGVTQFNINKKSYIGLNYINLFDLPKTVNDSLTEKYKNFVYTSNFKFDFEALYIFGEGGFSREQFVNNSNQKLIDITGEVFEIGLGKSMKNDQLIVNASFRRVSDDFYSAGAQSKRINYTTLPSTMTNASENMLARSIGLLDLVKDENIYNPTISSELMAYDYSLNHVTPYGNATPNRVGLDFEIEFTDSLQRYSTSLSAQLLQNTRGEGTTQLRNYTLINWYGNLYLDKIFELEKTLAINAGFQYASSARDGQNIIKDVDLKSNAIDFGAQIEIANGLDILLGSKMIYAQGTEYVNVRDSYNQIIDYNILDLDCSQQLNAIGLRYRFNDNVSITLQGSKLSYTNNTNIKGNYEINQAFMIFNMKF